MTEVLDDGRRFYVHGESIAEMAATNETWAWLASCAFANASTARVVGHHAQNSIELGLMRPEVADRLTNPVKSTRNKQLRDLLKITGHKPNIPYRPEPILPLLLPGEDIEATCWADGYYTFATGPGAAERMFADEVPMRALRRSIGAGEGPHDLTIVSGKLTLLDTASPNLSNAGPAERDVVLEWDATARNSYGLMLRGLVERVGKGMGGYTSDETRVVEDILGAQEKVLERASY
jgi:hypothetical protein